MIDRVQALGLYLTALALFAAPAGLSIGLALLWIGFLLSLLWRRGPPMAAGTWLALAFGIYVVVVGLAAPDLGGGLGARMDDAAGWVQLCVFVPVAHALRADQRRLLRLLVLALIGLLLGALWRLDWMLLWSDPRAFAMSRPGFGFPPIIFALFSGTALLGLFVLRDRWWNTGAAARRGWRILPWFVATAAVAQAFILTLARGAALALAATALFAVRLKPRGRDAQTTAPRRSWRTRLLAAALLLGLIGLNAEPILDRLGQEWGAVGAMLSGEIDYSQASSLSQRWHAQRFGIQAWLQRPWFGWGPGAGAALIARDGDPALRMEDGAPLVHLHNTYLEVLVEFGLVGLALWGAILVSLLGSVRAGLRARLLSPDVGRFLLLAILYLMLWSLFDVHAVHQGWRGFFALLAGAASSFGLYARER